jgi:triacylglycerol lipase
MAGSEPAVLTVLVIALIVGLVLAALAAGLVLVRRHRRKRAAPIIEPGAGGEAFEGVVTRPGPAERGPPLPVVLIHGLFGFDRIGVPGARLEYFRGIAAHLATLGCHAHAVRLPPARSVPARAEELVRAIEALPHDRIDLIAHSLGGLDARYALAHLGLARRVRSLVTICTPHRGTPLADLVLKGPIGWAHGVLRAVGLPTEAVSWLGTAALERFNREVRDVPGVRYACVVGGMRRAGTPVPLPLVSAHAFLHRAAGPNDGLVPVSSQYWGETLAEIEADHFAQVGWRASVRRTFDALGLYAFVVARLGDAPGAARTHPADAGSAAARAAAGPAA